jgi:peptidoglycan/LPS O-acetylase OafA/YrhL
MTMVFFCGVLLVVSALIPGACALVADHELRRVPDCFGGEREVPFILASVGFVGGAIGGFIYQWHMQHQFHDWAYACSVVMILATLACCMPVLETLTSPKWHNSWH